MKHNIQNKQVDNSSQPGPKPNTTTGVRVLHLPVSGIQGQLEMKHKFKINKLTTANSRLCELRIDYLIEDG